MGASWLVCCVFGAALLRGVAPEERFCLLADTMKLGFNVFKFKWFFGSFAAGER